MNTPAHLIIGAAAFARPDATKVNIAAIFGALAPDLSLYVMSIGAMLMGYSAGEVFDRLYFTDAWQQVFAIDNSFFVWGAILALSWWRGVAWGVAMAGAALLHIGLDFPLHHDDGRAHFWPISDWVFESPISYWDPRHHGGVVGAFEILLCIGLSVLLWRRFKDLWPRIGIAVLLIAEAAPSIIFGLMFAGGPS